MVGGWLSDTNQHVIIMTARERKRMRRLFGIVAITLLLVGCSSPTRSCQIKVSGTATEANITYIIGGSQSQSDQKLPWSHNFQHSDPYQPISVSAQNKGTGTITVEIIADGKVLKSGNATNEYGVATAAATLSEF